MNLGYRNNTALPVILWGMTLPNDLFQYETLIHDGTGKLTPKVLQPTESYIFPTVPTTTQPYAEKFTEINFIVSVGAGVLDYVLDDGAVAKTYSSTKTPSLLADGVHIDGYEVGGALLAGQGDVPLPSGLYRVVVPVSGDTLNAIPVAYVQTKEEIDADKTAVAVITDTLTGGNFITDDDAVLIALGNSKLVSAAMSVVDSGGGFQGLKAIGLSTTQAIRVLSIFNITIDTNKYESEVMIKLLLDDPTRIVSLKTYLESMSLTLPPLNTYAATIRANHDVYTAIKDWTI